VLVPKVLLSLGTVAVSVTHPRWCVEVALAPPALPVISEMIILYVVMVELKVMVLVSVTEWVVVTVIVPVPVVGGSLAVGVVGSTFGVSSTVVGVVRTIGVGSMVAVARLVVGTFDEGSMVIGVVRTIGVGSTVAVVRLVVGAG